MVNISYQQENTTCDISKKNILRSDSCEAISESGKSMGSQHGHLLHEMQAADALQQNMDDKKLKRYSKEKILAIKEDPRSKILPPFADERPFWANKKNLPPYQAIRVARAPKKHERNDRIGSGRLSTGDNFTPPAIAVQQYVDPPPPSYHQNNNNNNYYHHREKTGREFCENLKGEPNGGNGDYKAPFFNPVNRDHRRLLREKSEENLPEWVNAGPKSRFDTIDLHGFYDDKSNSRHESSSSSKGSDENNKENRDSKVGKTSFSFDEFLGSQTSGVDYVPDQHSSYNYNNNTHNNRSHGQSSRFKRYFNTPNNNNKNRDYHFAPPQHQQQHGPPGFPPIQNLGPRHFQSKFDTNNNNDAATALLELLHRQTNFDQFKHQSFNSFASSKNNSNNNNTNSGIPSASELESIWRHGNAERQRQFEQNKAMLAGKSIVDVIDVLTQSQLRANAMPFNNGNNNNQQQYNQSWNQYNNNNNNSVSNFMKSNNQMNNYQMARVLERQMMVQGQNPMYGGLTPQDPEYWDKIRQQQQAFYQQYERNAATRQVKAKFPGHTQTTRRVKFDERPKLENFFKHHNLMGDLPTIDPEKAIKVEEFERKIKQVAASCKQQEQQKIQ